MITYIISAVCSLLCCFLFFVIILALIGSMFLKKKGKTNASPKEMIMAGAEVSRAFVRGDKTREQLLAEEDEEERGPKRR